jgi:hypothetical protein
MHIDSYQFGEIVIDGAEYDSDCLITGNRIQTNWRRKQGHYFVEISLSTLYFTKRAWHHIAAFEKPL